MNNFQFTHGKTSFSNPDSHVQIKYDNFLFTLNMLNYQKITFNPKIIYPKNI